MSSCPDLPAAFDGYRILHVSDTHLDVLPDLVEAAQRVLAGLEVDLLALTGDVHGQSHGADLAFGGVVDRGPARCPGARRRALAVLGNHDAVEMAAALGGERLRRADQPVPGARARRRESCASPGSTTCNHFYTEAAPAAFDGHDGECRIALVHSAEMADVADRAGYALYLCGHTHGGQICLPGGKPIVTQLTRCRHAAVGLWRQGGMTGYTSAGLGVSLPTVRFNSRGEVAVITLRRGMVGAVGIEPTTPPV